MPVSDTTPEAEALQIKLYKAMTGEQRLLLACEMSDFVRDFARAGIRDRHPNWSEPQVTRELIRLTFLPEPLPAGF